MPGAPKAVVWAIDANPDHLVRATREFGGAQHAERVDQRFVNAQPMERDERFRHVVLMLDGDATGQRASHTIADRLCNHCTVRTVSLPANVQPDQLSPDAICAILELTLPEP